MIAGERSDSNIAVAFGSFHPADPSHVVELARIDSADDDSWFLEHAIDDHAGASQSVGHLVDAPDVVVSHGDLNVGQKRRRCHARASPLAATSSTVKLRPSRLNS
jgi:hypothetical protein